MKKALTVGRRTGEGRRFSGEYAADGKAVRLAARAAAGHRCIRCGHPFESGKHGRGEWSPCDEQCSHKGPIRMEIATATKEGARWIGMVSNSTAGEIVAACANVEAQWRILTVHHLDGDKSNDAWWNLLSLCQRCHLEIQGKVDPRIPWLFEHSEWIKPYLGAFFAFHYLGEVLNREEVMARLPELLALEKLTAKD